MLQRLDDLLLLELELGVVGERLPLAAAALVGVAAGRRHAARGGGEDLERGAPRRSSLAPRHPAPHAVAGHGAAHEDDEVVDAATPWPP